MADPRQSFAFDVSAPVQGSASGGPGYRQSNVQGGQAIVQDRSPAALGGTTFATELGDYFDQLMKPAVERKARERFVKGMTDQMYAEAGEEIRAGNGILTKIFGPSKYEEGAAFYESQQRVQNAVQGWSAREDELKVLEPKQVAQEWAKTMEAAKTGDTYLDDLTSQEMLKQASPMLQAVAKASYKHKQNRVKQAQFGVWTSAATTYQAQRQQFFDTSDPNDPEVAKGALAAEEAFVSQFLPPAGQDEDSYFQSLATTFRTILRNGDGHAASALVNRGLFEYLPEDQKVKLYDEYNRFAERASGDAAAQFLPDIDTLQGELEFGQLTGEQAVAKMRQINGKIKRYTGFDADYFDTDDQEGALKGVWSARKQAMDKQEARMYQEQREDAREAREDEKETRKAQMDASAAVVAWNSANPSAAIAAGAAKKGDVELVAAQAYESNDFRSLLKGFKSGIVATDVRDGIKNTMAALGTTEYSKSFDGMHQKFEGLLATNTALAQEYFGPAFAPMLNYRRLLTNNPPQIAYALAFGDPIQYSVDTPAVGKAKDAITSWVEDEVQPGTVSSFLGMGKRLNTSGAAELANLLGRNVAQSSKFKGGNLSDKVLIKGEYDRAIANGSFEQYGGLGWANRPGTQPLYRIMGMQQQEAAAVVESSIDIHLKRAGHATGVNDDEYTIVRAKYNGKDTLIVQPASDTSKVVVITADELADAGRRYRRSLRAPAAGAPRKAGFLKF